MNFAKYLRTFFYRTPPERFEHQSVLIFLKLTSVKKKETKSFKILISLKPHTNKTSRNELNSDLIAKKSMKIIKRYKFFFQVTAKLYQKAVRPWRRD